MNWRRRLTDDIISKMLPVIFKDVPDDKIRDISIQVVFEDLPGDMKGCCAVDGKEYAILLGRNQTRDDIVVNTCHELVHVMQTERGDEFDYSLPYMEQPHEIEAYAIQEELERIYNDKCN